MNCKLIAFDLDSTLLDDYKKISQENIIALEKAASNNILTVPASGRLFPYIPSELKDKPYSHYFILNNGGYIYDSVNDINLYNAELPLNTALELYSYLDTIDVIYDCYADNTGYASSSALAKADDYFTDPILNAMLHSYILKSRGEVNDLKNFIAVRNKPLQKISIFFRDESLRQNQLKLLPQMFPELIFTSSLGNNIEVNTKEATKGKALKYLCDYLNISAEDTVAFGDDLNDLDMITAAGLSVAMSNGKDLLKNKADIISYADNNHSGVAETLKRLEII